MKHILTTLLIALSVNCFSQSNDTLHVARQMHMSDWLNDTTYTTRVFYVDSAASNPRYDTIPCLMLVCDTLHYTNYTPNLNGDNYFDKAGQLMWVEGYEVKEFIPEGWSNGDDYHPEYLEHKNHLDGNLNPLSKYIIVWMSKAKNQ